jgi:hypothetical protein
MQYLAIFIFAIAFPTVVAIWLALPGWVLGLAPIVGFFWGLAYVVLLQRKSQNGPKS